MRLAGPTALASGLIGSLLGLTLALAGELRVIAPSAPGSGWDQLAQNLKAAFLDGRRDAAVSVVNLPGGGGLVGLGQFGASMSNDELLVTGLTMMDAALIGRSPVALERLTPIARLGSEPYVVAVPAGSAIQSLDDLRTALANPTTKLNWGGGPVGGVDHVGAVLLLRALHLEIGQVSYIPFLTSAEAATAAADDKVPVVFLAMSEIVAAKSEGKLRVLGLAAPQRLEGSSTPTLTEGGIPIAYANWRGILARSGLPDADRLRLEGRVTEALASPVWRAYLAKRGWRDAFLGGDAFGALIRDDQIRMREALKAAGVIKRQTD